MGWTHLSRLSEPCVLKLWPPHISYLTSPFYLQVVPQPTPVLKSTSVVGLPDGRRNIFRELIVRTSQGKDTGPKRNWACCGEAHLCWVRMCLAFLGWVFQTGRAKLLSSRPPNATPPCVSLYLFPTNQWVTASKSPNHSTPYSPPPQYGILFPSGSIILSDSVPHPAGLSLNNSMALLDPLVFPNNHGENVLPIENHLKWSWILGESNAKHCIWIKV